MFVDGPMKLADEPLRQWIDGLVSGGCDRQITSRTGAAAGDTVILLTS